ncbi:CD1845 family protein [Ruminococcaceae bacterium OttesenSCG-928-A11]|nr:CD1845 family protein [Ruminococcaceae bacterium OttesenSCG-928-A11]
MRVALKILSLPMVAILSITVMALSFLAVCAGAVLKLLSVPIALLGIGVAILTDPVAGLLILGGAFLISPFGLPLIANWLLDRLAGLNFTLREFIAN